MRSCSSAWSSTRSETWPIRQSAWSLPGRDHLFCLRGIGRVWSETGVSVLQNTSGLFWASVLDAPPSHTKRCRENKVSRENCSLQASGKHTTFLSHTWSLVTSERSDTSDLGPAGFRRVNERLRRSLCPAHLGPSTCAARSPVEVKTNKTDMGSGWFHTQREWTWSGFEVASPLIHEQWTSLTSLSSTAFGWARKMIKSTQFDRWRKAVDWVWTFSENAMIYLWINKTHIHRLNQSDHWKVGSVCLWNVGACASQSADIRSTAIKSVSTLNQMCDSWWSFLLFNCSFYPRRGSGKGLRLSMLLLPIPDLQLCTPNQRLWRGLALQRLPHFRMKKAILAWKLLATGIPHSLCT